MNIKIIIIAIALIVVNTACLNAQLENPSNFIQAFNSAQQLMSSKLATLESVLIKVDAEMNPTPEQIEAYRNDLNTIVQQISERINQVSDIINQIPTLAWDQDFKNMANRSGDFTIQLLTMLQDKITKALEQL